MTPHLLPDPATSFGERVRRRLRDEQVIWLTTVGADVLEGHPLPHELPGYLSKYRESMTRVGGSPEAFSEAYPVPVRVEVARVRGF